MEDDAPEHTCTRAGALLNIIQPLLFLWEQVLQILNHTGPAHMLPTALYPLGPAVPGKLFKHQSQVENPPRQGSESRQLFLCSQPHRDPQCSKAGAQPSPSRPGGVRRVGHKVSTALHHLPRAWLSTGPWEQQSCIFLGKLQPLVLEHTALPAKGGAGSQCGSG